MIPYPFTKEYSEDTEQNKIHKKYPTTRLEHTTSEGIVLGLAIRDGYQHHYSYKKVGKNDL